MGLGITSFVRLSSVCYIMQFFTEHSRIVTSEAFCQLCNSCIPPCIHIIEITDTSDVVPSKTITPTTTLPPRPSASSETVGELTLCVMHTHTHTHTLCTLSNESMQYW